MQLRKRIERLWQLFVELEETRGRNDKELLVANAHSEDLQLSRDLTFCMEVLTGKHKLGYTFYAMDLPVRPGVAEKLDSDMSLESFLAPLYALPDKSGRTIHKMCKEYSGESLGAFVQALLNREWRLGIGSSTLSNTSISPMLAKKLDVDKIPKSTKGYYITEKLDGNRCLSRYEDGAWSFWSRSGKRLNVVFDMSGFSTEHIYDGEIRTVEQIANPSNEGFNRTSGLINAKSGDKSSLIYHIFDIVDTTKTYWERRQILVKQYNSVNAKVLPLLYHAIDVDDLLDNIYDMLERITSYGGEGLMINVGDARYEQKRTDKLLKLKKVQTMDMRVVSLCEGTGRFEGMVGALRCLCKDKATGNEYRCNVGSGLSEEQRALWARHPEQIVDKIVEVSYFSTSKNANAGAHSYSLRFPRLRRLREDRSSTSVN